MGAIVSAKEAALQLHRAREGAIVSAKEAALQLHRALWGREFGGGSDRHHALTIAIACYGRCTQAAHEEREAAASIGGSGSRREVAGLREPAVPPAVYEYTTCDERERSGWSRAEERRSPFVLPAPGEHMPLPVLSRRACAVPAASVPVCERVFVFALLERYVLRGRRTFFAFVDTTLDMGSTRSVPCWLNP